MAENLYDASKDEQFRSPYIDVDEWREEPVVHHYIHGGFEGTLTRFCFYYPKKEDYTGRFFQPVSPFVGDEKESQSQSGAESKIAFAVTHGAYLVESNLGGIVNGGDDPTLMYRACAACAEYSRTLAREYYGEHRPFGYVYGGSGGGFKTISCVESTKGIWDGAMPFVIGCTVSMPNVFTVRAHAMRILRDKMDEIKDALEPGGGDPYACLNEEEQAALKEAELMGFPMKTWCVWDTIGEGALPVLTPATMMIDPDYVKDFWEKPGYLGSDPESSAVRDRIVHETVITKVLHPKEKMRTLGDTIDEGNAYGVDEAWKHMLAKGQKIPVFALESFPKAPEGHSFYSTGLKVRFVSGALAGETFEVVCLPDSCITVNPGMDQRNMEEVLFGVQAGDRVVLDNSDYIALQTFHRHQVPGPEFHPWDQFRDESGKPIYPQRPVQVGPIIAMGGAGSIQKGTPHCKIIVLESLMDESAFPWQADWYRNEVIKNMAPGTDGEGVMRLWYMENCMHTDCEEGNGGDHQHIVSYSGAMGQALLDLSDWVERGIEPAHTTGYKLDCGSVLVADTAKDRRGIQQVVTMTVNGQKKVVIGTGDTIRFQVKVELAPGGGDVEKMLWDFEGSDAFLQDGEITGIQEDSSILYIENAHTFESPGTYFPVVKIACNRNQGDIFTSIYNQDRVRVVVE